MFGRGAAGGTGGPMEEGGGWFSPERARSLIVFWRMCGADEVVGWSAGWLAASLFALRNMKEVYSAILRYSQVQPTGANEFCHRTHWPTGALITNRS